MQARLERLSPLDEMPSVAAPVELAAPPRDKYFPLSESRRLVRRAPRGRLTVTRALSHADLTPSLGEASDLLALNPSSGARSSWRARTPAGERPVASVLGRVSARPPLVVLLALLAALARHGRGADPPPGPCQDLRAALLLCPDLRMRPPYDLELDRRTRRGRVLLRAANSIDSIGLGPAELVGRRDTRVGMRVVQRIHRRDGGSLAVATRPAWCSSTSLPGPVLEAPGRRALRAVARERRRGAHGARACRAEGGLLPA